MAMSIVEDYGAIRARMEAIRQAERAWTQAPAEPSVPAPTPALRDFHDWLFGGGLWAPAARP